MYFLFILLFILSFYFNRLDPIFTFGFCSFLALPASFQVKIIAWKGISKGNMSKVQIMHSFLQEHPTSGPEGSWIDKMQFTGFFYH